jgi:Prolipoprotein diacylglyceryl transferase
VYPVLFRIGDFEITSFGVAVGVAALVGIWIFGRELRRSGLPADAVNAAIGGVIGGLIGAKLLWTIEFSGQQPINELLFSRGGLSWFGGMIGGVGTGLWLLHRHKVPLIRGLATATPALAIGHLSGASDVSWSATTTEDRRNSHGVSRFQTGCRPRTFPCIPHSCTKRSLSRSWHGCFSDGAAMASQMPWCSGDIFFLPAPSGLGLSSSV